MSENFPLNSKLLVFSNSFMMRNEHIFVDFKDCTSLMAKSTAVVREGGVKFSKSVEIGLGRGKLLEFCFNPCVSILHRHINNKLNYVLKSLFDPSTKKPGQAVSMFIDTLSSC